jgi:hypothetical protein
MLPLFLLAPWTSLTLATLFAIVTITQVVALNKALEYEIPLLVLPLFYCTFTGTSVVNALVYSGGGVGVWEYVYGAGGLILLFIGVWAL